MGNPNLFEGLFGPKESIRHVPSSEELEKRDKGLELQLRQLIEKREDMRRRMRVLEREQDDFEPGQKPQRNARSLGDILCDKGNLLREMNAIQMEINRVFEDMQRDDEVFKNIAR